MKKFIVLAVALLFVFGCEKNREESFHSQPTESSAFEQMQALNDSLMVSSTRGWWKHFRNACAIAGADIAGAGAGIYASKELAAIAGAVTGGTGAVVVTSVAAVICSVGASSLAYDACYGTGSTESEVRKKLVIGATVLAHRELEITPVPVKIKIPSRFHYLNNAGALHNRALLNMDKIRSGEIDLDKVDLDSDTRKIVLSKEFNDAYDAIMKATVIDTSTGTIHMGNYVEVELLVDKYIQIVEDSGEFSNEEKEQIYIGLVVAAESPLFWERNL